MSTPARVSCIVHSVREEEERTTLFHLEPRLESISPLEESGNRLGAYTGHRGEEVRRFQETADLGSRRTLTRGSQDVTAADKSEVGRAIRGPRGSGRVEPSDSPTTSPVARIVLVMLWQILYLARAGTFFPSGVENIILVTLWHTLCSVRTKTALPLEFRVTVRTGPITVMYYVRGG